jgi:hypothetical protein
MDTVKTHKLLCQVCIVRVFAILGYWDIDEHDASVAMLLAIHRAASGRQLGLHRCLPMFEQFRRSFLARRDVENVKITPINQPANQLSRHSSKLACVIIKSLFSDTDGVQSLS